MSDNMELSRRKILGGVGAVGAAGAAAGLGTTALFSDEESFENNSITAGTLDLKIGWEEHYFNGKRNTDFTTDSGVSAGDVGYVSGSAAGGRTTLPLAASNPQNGAAVSVPDQSTALSFLDVTEVDQYPDGTNTYDEVTDSNACDILPDGSDQSPVIIDLDDVKPGDFGEITFSFALCDNPGYLWAQGDLQSASENGTTEPEADSPNETSGTVELLDAAQAALWYDNGDNLQSGGSAGGGGANDVVIVLDDSGSVGGVKSDIKDGAKDLIDILSQTDAAASVAFSGSAEIERNLTVLDSTSDRNAVKNDIDNFTGPGGGTDIISGLEAAEDELDNNGRGIADPFVILISDGNSFGNYPATADDLKDPNASADPANSNLDITIGAIGFGSTNDSGLTNTAGRDPNTPNDDQGLYIDTTDPGAPSIQQAFSNLGSVITVGEEVIISDSLRNVLNALDANPPNDYGLPLDGDRSSSYDEQAGAPDGSGRDPFAGDTKHDIGFAWWIPRSVGNQIQSDSATFSLSFYAVQSRNNPGFGNA